jgi:hypothetical protein
MAFSKVPNQADFTTFLRNVAEIDVAYLPDASDDITNAFIIAKSSVNCQLACLPGNLYALAIYNLGTDQIINYAMDQTGRTYFKDLRKTYGINLFVPGVTSSSGDASTSQARLNPEFMKNLTFGDLQNLKTPFGRAYLNIAQQTGTLWGLT